MTVTISGEAASNIDITIADPEKRVIISLPPPVFPKLHIGCNIECKLDDNCAMIFSGNCMAFADKLMAAGFNKKRVKMNPEDAYPTIYYFKNDIPAEELSNFHEEVVQDIFANCPIIVNFQNEVNNKGKEAFLQSVKKTIRCFL